MFRECNLKLSYTTDTHKAVTNFKLPTEDTMFEQAEKILKFKGGFSNLIFKDNYRKKENYIQNMSNVIIFDIDDGMTINEFISRYKGQFAFAIGTTKSHMKDKNGVVCDRFRVLLPTETAIDLDHEGYSNMMREIMLEFPFIDKQCKDAARFYFGNPDAEVTIVYGDLFDWEIIQERAAKRKALLQWKLQNKASPQLQNNGSKADWYRENWLSDAMRKALKVDEKFAPGGRNNAIYSISRYLKDIELTDSEVQEAIEWINNGELPDQEIKQVLKGLRITT